MIIVLRRFIVVCLLVSFEDPVCADVRLPAIFGDHMVLQSGKNVPIWGNADPGEEITLRLQAQTWTTRADTDGHWQAKMDLSTFGSGPFELAVQGKNRIVISDVVIGQVWLASGQSNMELPLRVTADAAAVIAGSADNLLREFKVERTATPQPAKIKGHWTVATPETSGEFSAVGYYFAKKLRSGLQVPVGIVNSSYGGTMIESWIPRDAIDADPVYKAEAQSVETANTLRDQRKKEYVAQFGAWLQSSGRSDRPTVDLSVFAAEDAATTDWTPVTLPGKIIGPGLPPAGAVWIRREVDIPTNMAGRELATQNSYRGYQTIYWNGEKISGARYQNAAVDSGRRFAIPGAKVRSGSNVLAIRFYAPTDTPAVDGDSMRMGPAAEAVASWSIDISGNWLAKGEYELPVLSPTEMAAVPAYPGTVLGPVASQIYNGMVSDIVPFDLAGVIWYQGESNAVRAYEYRHALPLLITSWRQKWNRDDLPFYICQLPSFGAKKPQITASQWAEMRESQSMALRLPGTGVAVLIDTGESVNIHPVHKTEAGERLAALALAKVYAQKIPCEAPSFKAVNFEGGEAQVTWNNVEGGLVAKPLPAFYEVNLFQNKSAPLVPFTPDSQVQGFALCGADHQWFWANARIEGDAVIISSDKVPQPVAVRYAWADFPTCNLYDGAGLPAAPFRSDDFLLSTENTHYGM